MEKRIIKQYREIYIVVDETDYAGVEVHLPEDFVTENDQINLVWARNQAKLEELYNDS